MVGERETPMPNFLSEDNKTQDLYIEHILHHKYEPQCSTCYSSKYNSEQNRLRLLERIRMNKRKAKEIGVDCNKGTMYPETCALTEKCIICGRNGTHAGNSLCLEHWADAEGQE